MKNTFKYIIAMLFIASFSSCDEDGFEDFTIETTPVLAISGDWYAVALNPDGQSTAFGGDFVKFTTVNSTENDNTTFWLDDNDNWMQLKSKAIVNISDLTFESEPNTPELYTDETVSITNGRITKGTYTTTSNSVVDQIFFDAEFSWDPGTVYKYEGHRRTGFLEDENPEYSN